MREAINAQFNSLFTTSASAGRMTLKPNVCGVCDEFIKLCDICILSFKELKECHSILGRKEGIFYHEGCRDYYFRMGEEHDNTVPWHRMFLSPATQVRCLSNNHDEKGILTCRNCADALRKRQLPKMAISNGFFFGSPPDCLLCLTEVERAFLTPVKTYGYCFSYTGGFQKELKGSLSYYRVKMASIARTAAHFVTLGMADNIVVLLYGRMTTEQKKKALNKNKMRTGHLLTAITWLCTHNSEWKKNNIDIASIASRLKNPLLIDNSTEIEGARNSNIEKTESIQIFFPDTAIDVCTGGQDTVEDFKLLIQEAKSNGYDFELQADLLRESVTDYKDNNLVNACLIQFPYGCGGINEERVLSEKKLGLLDIESYASHVSRISRPHFNEELFVLILYNMKMKIKMVRGASWRVRHVSTASMLATELNEEDIDMAVRNRRAGILSSGAGEQFLKAIDAIGRGVAHTNEAAKKARRTAECLQHNFGMPTHFLTVTPDDDNCILVQSYSQTDIDINSAAVDDMDAAEIERMSRKRKELRIKVPGIAAKVFEDILDIIIETVIGWDRRTNSAKIGLFGTPVAFTCTIEEQGRKTLHTHIQIWTKEVYDERSRLYSLNRETSRDANRTLCKEADRTMGTSFFFNENDRSLYQAAIFPHECTVRTKDRRLPVPVPDQKLRELRYKQGNALTGTTFATCRHCPKSWKYDELVSDYVLYNVKDPGYVTCGGEGDVMLRMKAKTLEYQKQKDQKQIPSYVIEAGYNLHNHTSSCFKKTLGANKGAVTMEERTRVKKRLLHCECRYRLPVRKKRRTVIVDACEHVVKWYDWTGKYVERNIKELNLRRGAFDLFQNQSCPAIGESKLSCNTNVNLIFHGSTGQYAFKYCTKSTQQDDRAEFDRVMEQKDKILSKIPHAHGERSEATRRLLLASFAHQRSNVIGAPLSSFLTRNEERFIFSHQTVWIPIKDLKSLLTQNHVSSSAIIYHGKTPFFLCVALHYLTRPAELENMCVFDFYSEYEVVRVTRKTVDSLFHFRNTEFFTHPSYRQNSDSFLQGVRKRHQKYLPKIFQFDFPDTACFNTDILTTDQISEEMESYAEMICVLFLPFHSTDDLQHNGSYVLKLRQSIDMLTEAKQTFLNNIQDAKANCLRITNLKDDLQRVTSPMSYDDGEKFQNWRDDEQEEDTEEMQGETLDNFLEELDRDNEEDEPDPEGVPTSLHVKKLKDKGRKQCGYRGLCHLAIPSDISSCQSLTSMVYDTNGEFLDTGSEDVSLNTAVKDIISKNDIVRIVMQRTNRITRSFKDISGRGDDVDVLEANGSVDSIFDWAKKAGLDQQQRRAFEIIIGHFLLTFVLEAVSSSMDEPHSRRVFNKQKSQLYKLLEKDSQSSTQTICLLYGPGGSGKTTVIDLTLEYAREYCSFFDEVEFNARTIVVTALTGVAATIIRGETTHAAVYLNQRKELQPKQVEMWNNTRLLIVDEVSFASKEVFIELDKKLRKLKCKPDSAYGGLSVIFSGDFRQLEPVGYSQQPIYKDPCPQFNDWINCFIELQGMHRFKDDLEWGFLLRRFRDGQATDEDINIINSRVVTATDDLPHNIRYATYFNRDRDAINAALFEQRCMDMQSAGLPLHDSILILSDNHFVQNGSRVYTTFRNPRKIWEECGEDDIKVTKGSHRMDPVLRLYRGCRVMLPHNEDVRNGIANGTQATVVGVNICMGVVPFYVMINETCSVQAVFASQVESVELEHVNTRISPRIFRVNPKQHTFKATISKPKLFKAKGAHSEQIQMRATQIPILVNNATTGHKLQGCGVPAIFIHGWSIVRNWAYVVLSRVRTLSGLYLREELDGDLSNYAIPDELQNLLRKFRNSFSPMMWTEEQYRAKFDTY